MAKGKFEPGKRVVLLNGTAEWARSWTGKQATLEALDADRASIVGRAYWFLKELREERAGFRCAWSQRDMILLDDPDLETPEQSADVMRDLHKLQEKLVSSDSKTTAGRSYNPKAKAPTK